MERKVLVSCPVPINDVTAPNSSVPFPWTHSRPCLDSTRGGNHKFCVYTSANSGPYGISVLTTPDRAAHLAGFVADTYQPAVPDVPYHVVDIPGKGRGAVATRLIKKGEPILNDYAALIFDSRALDYLEKSESDILLQLAADRLAEPFRVYEGARSHPEHGIVMDVIATNAFHLEVEDEAYYRLFPQIALLNHACAPNARPRFSPRNFAAVVSATRDIAKGEEVTLTYLSTGVPSDERRERIKHWGFECGCDKCTAAESEILTSDQRIRRMERELDALDSHVEAGNVTQAFALAREILLLSRKEEADLPEIRVYEALKDIYLGLGSIQQAKRYASKIIHMLVMAGYVDERDETTVVAAELEALEEDLKMIS